MPYDFFISYSRRDSKTVRITELKERIAADYLAHARGIIYIGEHYV